MSKRVSGYADLTIGRFVGEDEQIMYQVEIGGKFQVVPFAGMINITTALLIDLTKVSKQLRSEARRRGGQEA